MRSVGTMIFSREDIRRILEALASAGEPHGAKYRQALHDVGLAVGAVLVEPQPVTWRVVDAITERRR